MATTSALLVSGFFNEMIIWLPRVVDESSKRVARLVWTAIMTLLAEHGFEVAVILIITFIAVLLLAFVGFWGPLGSFLYNFLYFSALLIVGSIWGPEIFVNDIFSAALTLVLYLGCYRVTGLLLKQIRMRLIYCI